VNNHFIKKKVKIFGVPCRVGEGAQAQSPPPLNPPLQFNPYINDLMLTLSEEQTVPILICDISVSSDFTKNTNKNKTVKKKIHLKTKNYLPHA
jgi:hypothetical protein